MPINSVLFQRVAHVALLLLLLPGACRRMGNGVVGSGVAKSEARGLEPFREVAFEGGGKLTLSIGPAQTLTVTADDNILPLIETEVIDGRLHIQPSTPIRPELVPTVTATLPELTFMLIDGAADATVEGVANESLRLDVLGAGRVYLSGKTRSLTVKSEGAGLIDARGLEAKSVTVELTGAGAAHVHAVETLDVTIKGVGSVTYRGEPTVTKQVLGPGSVSRD